MFLRRLAFFPVTDDDDDEEEEGGKGDDDLAELFLVSAAIDSAGASNYIYI